MADKEKPINYIISREGLVKLRKDAIKYLSKDSKEISKLTEILIDYPTMKYLEKIREWPGEAGRGTFRSVDVSYGAFGETEGDLSLFITVGKESVLVENIKSKVLVINEKNLVEGIVQIDINKISNKISQKVLEKAQEQVKEMKNKYK